MKKVWFIFLVVAVVAIAIVVPREQRRVSIKETIDSFRLDAAVWEERQNNPKDREKSAEVWLNPPYLRKYGLDMNSYLDKSGYFAPTGADWKKWNIATRAASICMWRDNERRRSPEEIDGIIEKIDAYYSSHPESEAVITVLNVVERL
jgi:hypothetical protein